MGGIVGCAFVLMVLMAVGVFVAKRMKRQPIELGDIESHNYYKYRQSVKKADHLSSEKIDQADHFLHLDQVELYHQ
jgi:hypothetical protein